MIGQRIKQLRKSLKLTQSAFAEKIRRNRSTVANIEGGSITLSPSTRKAICSEFNASEEWILTGKGDLFCKGGLTQKEQVTPVIQGNYQTEFRVSEALTMCVRVLESGTSYATALFLNIQHFDRAIAAEARITNIEVSQKNIAIQFDELLLKVEQLESDNKTLRTEVNRLKATYENPDQGSGHSTDTEKQAM